MVLYVIMRLRFDRFGSQSPGGGIGRHAGFRYLWPQGRGSSSLLLGTISIEITLNQHHILRSYPPLQAPIGHPNKAAHVTQGLRLTVKGRNVG